MVVLREILIHFVQEVLRFILTSKGQKKTSTIIVVKTVIVNVTNK